MKIKESNSQPKEMRKEGEMTSLRKKTIKSMVVIPIDEHLLVDR